MLEGNFEKCATIPRAEVSSLGITPHGSQSFVTLLTVFLFYFEQVVSCQGQCSFNVARERNGSRDFNKYVYCEV